MKYHWSMKLLCFVLAMVCGAVFVMSGIGIINNLDNGYYVNGTPQTQLEYQINERAWNYAVNAAQVYASIYQMERCPEEYRTVWKEFMNAGWYDQAIWPQSEHVIQTTSGYIREDTRNQTYEWEEIIHVSVNDGKIIALPAGVEYPRMEELKPGYVWQDADGNPLPEIDSRTIWYDLVSYEGVTYRVEHFEDQTYLVTVYLTQSDLQNFASQEDISIFNNICYTYRYELIGLAVVTLVLTILCLVWLAISAGRRPGTDQILPKGMNRIPLELYGAVVFAGEAGLIFMVMDLYTSFWRTTYFSEFIIAACVMAALVAVGILLVLGLFTAFCAQLKARMIFSNMLLVRMVKKLWDSLKKLLGRFAPNRDMLRKLMEIAKGIVKNIPLMGQWLALYCVLLVITVWVASTFRYHGGVPFFLVGLAGVIIVGYTAHAIGVLRNAAKRMSQGELGTKIIPEDVYLFFNFADFAEDLNALGDACVEAAREKMKSERMKSELITNVSHDIKTPLTSIINYVDLLQKAKTEEEREEYLTVLDRQSQKLKKLIEDLMEMSKTSSGNISVELAATDVVEGVNQALGEYADALERQGLTVVLRKPNEVLTASCDGKLLWRVLSNVLGNVVKYSLPNTRVYVDVTENHNTVQIAVKNISREPLNVSAEELTERFVRGDASRNTEGSGLGLNIAKGLMELQQGGLELVVDGDLFKVVLTLPRA